MVRNSSVKGLESVHPVQGLLNAPVHPGAFCCSLLFGSSAMSSTPQMSSSCLSAVCKHVWGVQSLKSE